MLPGSRTPLYLTVTSLCRSPANAAVPSAEHSRFLARPAFRTGRLPEPIGQPTEFPARFNIGVCNILWPAHLPPQPRRLPGAAPSLLGFATLRVHPAPRSPPPTPSRESLMPGPEPTSPQAEPGREAPDADVVL